MKRLLLALFMSLLTFGFVIEEAEARRMGGGRSVGMQRQAAPKQAQPAPRQAAPNRQATATPQRNWMGPVAGLLAGIGLYSLFAHFGLGEGLANLFVIGLMVILAIWAFNRIFRRPEPVPHATSYSPHASDNQASTFFTPQSSLPGSFGATDEIMDPNIPAGFDSEAFLRVAKLNFVRLQAANDAKNIEDIREFVSPEVFAEIKLQMVERGDAPQQTDVVTLDAELLEVITEGARHIASVHFSGIIREEAGAAALPFEEIWHLSKPADGSHGWVVSGIQQI